ncbi:MAG: hydantoinase/oxoprolinase family protein [Parvibaculaceae bacterium]
MGVDTGGTFTDLVTGDPATGRIDIAKVSSTPGEPWKAVLDAILASGVDPTRVSSLTLGTTVGTNAILQRRGARVIYITTLGFEDVPFIQRIQRKHLYDLQWQKPKPFCFREDCIGVAERIDASGRVVRAVEPAELEKLAAAIEKRLAVDPDAPWSIAVNFLCSFANPVHEEQVGAFLEERFPDVPCSLSHLVSPVWREYERGTTVSVDAFLKPIVAPFAVNCAAEVAGAGVKAPLTLMKSNGGRVGAGAAADRPIDLILSGLAGGMIAARHYARSLGLKHAISLDMGGTSADVGLVQDGDISFDSEFEIEFGLPVATPIVDIHTIGAGGSSIAAIDPGGRLSVGPASAGADPGPACYARGGTAPTVTDANLVIGRLDAEFFLGGALRLEPELALRSVSELAASVGLDRVETALAILDIAAENMANAIRMITVERGLDVRDFALLAFGGAGPLHTVAVAESLGIKTIVVPPHPGTVSALGAMLATPRVDRRWTRPFRATAVDLAVVEDAFARMAADARAELRGEGVSNPTFLRSASLRYQGQNFEQEISLSDGPITSKSIVELAGRFHARHEEIYGYALREHALELVHFGLTAMGTPWELKLSAPSTARQPDTIRPVLFRGSGWVDTRVVARGNLKQGDSVEGPAIVAETTSTTLVPPGYTARVAAADALLLEPRQ